MTDLRATRRRDFTGQRFCRLVAVRLTDRRTKSKNLIWEMLCDCGSTCFCDTGKLSKGLAKSCGCIRRTQFSCSVNGCEQTASSHHLCNKHLWRKRNGAEDLTRSATGTSNDIQERFSAKTRRTENGCLEWTGTIGKPGYGQTSFNGKRQNCHRLAWIISNGAIPEGLSVLHRCDNRACIDVSHLFLGTQKDNIQDAVRKGRMNWQRKS